MIRLYQVSHSKIQVLSIAKGSITVFVISYIDKVVHGSVRLFSIIFIQLPCKIRKTTFLTRKVVFLLCAGQDSNLRRPKPTGLQPVVIDRSTTDALCIVLTDSIK